MRYPRLRSARSSNASSPTDTSTAARVGFCASDRGRRDTGPDGWSWEPPGAGPVGCRLDGAPVRSGADGSAGSTIAATLVGFGRRTQSPLFSVMTWTTPERPCPTPCCVPMALTLRLGCV